MKLSDKIFALRKQIGMTQEDLADKCHVSRQTVSKWETDIALPEIDKLLILSDIFHVSVDVLIKDELELDGTKQVHACGKNAAGNTGKQIFDGILIKESIDDEAVLDAISVHKVELWNTGGKPKYWTVLYFTSVDPHFPEIVSKAIIADADKGGNWFVDFKSGNIKYIVFRNKILTYHIGNREEKALVCMECKKMGITEDEMHWAE